MTGVTTVTIEPERESEHTDLDAYVERAREELNPTHHDLEVVDGRLVIQFSSVVGRSAERRVKAIAGMGDRVAVVHGPKDDDEYFWGHAYRVFKTEGVVCKLNKVKEAGGAGDDVFTIFENTLGFEPARGVPA